MILFVIVTCWIGIVAAVADDKDETESLEVSEGESLTISIHIKESDKDPQVLVTRLKGSSQEPIAQLFCHDGDCKREAWESGVSLIYDGGNVTLVLMNVSSGLYSVRKLSDTQPENKIYNVTVYQARLSITSPSVVYSKSFAVVITSGVFITLVLIITGAIAVVYWRRSKVNVYKMSQNDDSSRQTTADSSLSGSLALIDV